jgi:tape measure domain-containing protein
VEGGKKPMSTQVDKRLVQMGFDNKDFERGVKESDRSLKGLDKSLQNLGQNNLGALGGSVLGVGGNFTALGTIATGALLKIGSQAVVLGQKMVHALAIEPVTQGYEEYELKVNSIKTMLAGGRTAEGLPVTLDMVNEQLRLLNNYSDQTIYSFADMTQNIGKFTNAGVDLETSVQAIKGIANAAALSGANSNEASRAMYNFAQALSAGYVKLIDWKSIENANMATVEFKQQLLDAAVAAGTLEKQADGMYKVLTANNQGSYMEQTIDATKNFNDSLQYQWMTTTALTDTLTDYADSTTEIGAKATEAATKVRTFTQLMDTTKEAIGSGWSLTFELIIGDYDQATEVYTGLSDAIGGIVETMSDARNGIVSEWAELGGRTDLIEAIISLWKRLGEILKPIGEAFSKVFPAITGRRLAEITESFRILVDSITYGNRHLKQWGKIWEGIFSAIYLAGRGIKVVFDVLVIALKKILTYVPSGGKILSLGADIGQFFIDLKKSAKEGLFFEDMTAHVGETIETLIDRIAELVTKIRNTKLEDLEEFFNVDLSFLERIQYPDLSILKDVLTDVKDFFVNLASMFRITESSFDSISTGITGLGKAITAFFETTKSAGSSARELRKVGEPIREIRSAIKSFSKSDGDTSLLSKFLDLLGNLPGILEPVGRAWQDVNMDQVIDGLYKFGQLFLAGGLVFGIRDFLSSLGEFGGFSKLMKGLGSSTVGILNEVKDTMKAYQTQLKAEALMEVAKAIAVLAAAIIALSFVPQDRLQNAAIAIGGLFAALMASFVTLEKGVSAPKLSLISVAVGGMATAIAILSGAMIAMSFVNPDNMGQAFIAISGVMGAFAAFVLSAAKASTGKFGMQTLAMTAMAGAIKRLANVAIDLSKIDQHALGQGVAVLSALFAMLGGLVLIISGKGSGVGPDGKPLPAKSGALSNLAGGFSIGAIASGIKKLAGVVVRLGEIDSGKVTQGTLAVGALLGMITATLTTLANPQVLAGGAALVLVSAAMIILAGAVAALGGIKIGTFVKSVSYMIILLTVLGIAGYALGPVVPVIVALAGGIFLLGGAVALMGIGMFAAGVGMSMFAAGLTTIIALGTGSIALIVAAIAGLAVLIPLIMGKVAEGLIEFAVIIGKGAPKIAWAFGMVVTAVVDMLVNQIPRVVEAVFTLVLTILEKLAEKMPAFVQVGWEISLAFIKGIAENIGELTALAVEIITEFTAGLAENLPELIIAGADLMIAYMQGMQEKIPELTDEAFKTVIAFVNGLADAVRENTPEIIQAATNMATAFIDGLIEYFGIETNSSSEGKAIAESLMYGFLDGILAMTLPGVAGFVQAGEAMIDGWKQLFGIESPSTVMYDLAKDVVQGLINGLRSMGEELAIAAGEGVTAITSPFLTLIEDIYDVGVDIAKGLIDGLKSKLSEVVEAAKAVGSDPLQAIKNILDIQSPSRKTYEVGLQTGQGLANGLRESLRFVVNSMKTFGGKSAGFLSDLMNGLMSKLNEDIDMSPVITPVLDLSQVRAGAGELARLFGATSSQTLAQSAASQDRALMGVQNGSDSGQISTTQITNTFNLSDLVVRSDLDIELIAEQLYSMQEQALRGRGIRPSQI